MRSSVVTPDFGRRQLAAMRGFDNTFSHNNRFRMIDSARWPGHWRTGPGWANLGYYTGYWYNGATYPAFYYAPEGFCPTPYLFYAESGEFWEPGFGYSDYLPYGYHQPITVAVNEIVPVYDAYGDVIDYRQETFYYNAFWDDNAQAYGFYDYRGAFHWLTYPWLQSWYS
jgi:hypothetical protein